MLFYGGVKAHHMKNNTNVDLKSKDLPLFALAWQSWKLLDTSAGIVFKGALVAGAFFLFGTALSGGPFFNEKTRIRMQAQEVCKARGLMNPNNNRYDVYRFCEAFAVQYANDAVSRDETQVIY